MRRARVLGLVTSVTLAATVAGGLGASAASLNGATSAPLGGWVYPATSVAPNVLAWASFNGATNTNLDGQALNGGGTWIVDTGSWRIQGNRARSSNTAMSNIGVDVGTPDAAVIVTLTVSGTTNAGVLANDDGTAALYALYSRSAGGTIRLYKYVGGATVLATATGVGTAAGTIELDSRTTTVTVSWNGTQVLSYALTPTEAATLHGAGNSRFGLIADGDGTTRFDDFHVDQ
jgi:hypothetical protein